MRQSGLERRLLELVYTTDAPITAASFAYFAPCPLEEANQTLLQLARAGTLLHNSDEHGNVFYVFPNRQRMPPPVPPPRQNASSPMAATMIPLAAASAMNPVMNVQQHLPAVRHVAPAPPRAGAESAVCPFCAETILAAAKKCKHCGEMLDPSLRALQFASPVQVNVQNVQSVAAPQVVLAGKEVSAGVAALLSFLWPGAGQLYCGSIAGGLLWMFFVFLGYVALIIPGLILHLLCIISASSTANSVNAGRARILVRSN